MSLSANITNSVLFGKRAQSYLPLCLVIYLTAKGFSPGLPGFRCIFLSLTGCPCPACFLTRSVAAAFSGQFGLSLQYHLLGIPIALFLVFYSVSSIKAKQLSSLGWKPRIVGAIAVVFLIYWLVRIAATFILGAPAILSFPEQINNIQALG